MLLAKTSPYVSASASLFNQLVCAGEEGAGVTLPAPLHAFLVACLAEHAGDPDIVHRSLAIEFLGSVVKRGNQGAHALKRTGDEALLLAGLFPLRALRLRVTRSYFRFVGQGAYASLAAHLDARGMPQAGKFFDHVAIAFPLLTEVLQGARSRPSDAWESFKRFEEQLLN